MSELVDISQSDIDDFSRDGAIVIRDAIGDRWLESLRVGVDKNFEAPGPDATQYTPEGEPGNFYDDYCNWERIHEYRDFVMHSPAAFIMGQLMGAREVRIYHEHVLVKEPGTKEITPWHHDLPYYGVDGHQLASMWLPLDPVPKYACPEFVAGSHRWGKRFVPRLFISHNNYTDPKGEFGVVPDIDGERDRHQILSWDLELGDCIVFHMLTVHGAPGLETLKTRRRGFSTRWMGDDAVFATRPWATSPPFQQVQLNPGDPMHHEAFPVVWQA